MENFINFWWILGVLLIIAEFIIPGLVVVFVGLGAVTVAGLMHLGYLDNIVIQFLIWFSSSIFYCFTLRLIVIKFYPSDIEIKNLDENFQFFGQIATVTQKISPNITGRISFSDSTWPAKLIGNNEINIDEKVKLVGRDNITWIVEKTN